MGAWDGYYTILLYPAYMRILKHKRILKALQRRYTLSLWEKVNRHRQSVIKIFMVHGADIIVKVPLGLLMPLEKVERVFYDLFI